MGRTTNVQLHFKGPIPLTRALRRMFTPRGFQAFSPTPGYEGLYAHLRAYSYAAYPWVHDELCLLLTSRVSSRSTARVTNDIARRVASYVYAAEGELVYEFAVWKVAVR